MHRHSHSHAHSYSHDDAPADGPEYHLPEEDNGLGAAIFFVYIAAALILTVTIALHIGRLHRASNTTTTTTTAKPPPSRLRSAKLTFLVLMSLVSFTTLSYHMLHVLIQSYNAWTVTHGSVDPSLLYQGLFPFNLIDYLTAYARSILHWSTTSTLFTQFAQAILATPFRRIWTRLVLYYSLAFSIWMSDTGIQHHIPHLPWYFLLAQILPISFTQHLFLLAFELIRSGPATTGTTTHPHAPSQLRANYLTYLLLTLFCTLLIDRINATILNSPLLVPLIFTIRLLLFLPLLIPRLTPYLPSLPFLSTTTTTSTSPSPSAAAWAKSPAPKLIASILLGWQLRIVQAALGTPGGWAGLAGAVDEHPAVSALGYDLGLAVVGAGVYAGIRLLEAAGEGEGEGAGVGVGGGRSGGEGGGEGEGEGERNGDAEGVGKADGGELLGMVQGKLSGAVLGAEAQMSLGVDGKGQRMGGGGLQERLDQGLKARGRS